MADLDRIEYKGKSYTGRWITIFEGEADEETVLIAEQKLEDDMDCDYKKGSTEARDVDEQIYAYTDDMDILLNSDDEAFAEYVEENYA